MICRTQVAVQSTNSAMAALLMWPDESMTILALRLLTALRRCLFKRRSLTFSKGRKGRTLIVSFMMHLQVKVAKNSTWRCFTLLGAHQLSVTLPILPSRPYFNESCQLKTAVLSQYCRLLCGQTWRIQRRPTKMLRNPTVAKVIFRVAL